MLIFSYSNEMSLFFTSFAFISSCFSVAPTLFFCCYSLSFSILFIWNAFTQCLYFPLCLSSLQHISNFPFLKNNLIIVIYAIIIQKMERLEKWLSSSKCVLLFQRTQGQFPAPPVSSSQLPKLQFQGSYHHLLDSLIFHT